MKNVSFGDLIEKKEGAAITNRQKKIGLMASDYLENSQPRNGMYIGLSDRLRDKMCADILVLHKKNGSVEIKLAERPDVRKDWGFSWIKKEDNAPLILSAKTSYDNISKKLSEYAEKLWGLSSKYEDEVEQYKLDNEPSLTPEQKTANAELADEEDFEREFGVGAYEDYNHG